MAEQERPFAAYQEQIPESHRSRGWRVRHLWTATTMVGGLTLYMAWLTDGSRPRRSVASEPRESEEAAVDDAVRKLMRLEPLA